MTLLPHLILISLATAGPELASVERAETHMGSRFEMTAVAAGSLAAEQAISAAFAEIQRIESLISSWDPASQTSAINRNAGIAPVIVDRELFELIRRSLKVAQLTQGSFDISFAAVDRIWKFDGSMQEIPDSALVARSVALVNWQDILLDAETHSVFLRKKGMKVGFGGIGKGYAANRARKVMQEMGIQNGLVNAGGDLTAWGAQADGRPWHVAIADPRERGKIAGWLQAHDLAVVTSGDYERYVMLEDKRYAHIINPATGWPVSGLYSVSIACSDAELADALATAVFVMGEKHGLELINQLNGIDCLLITADGRFVSTKGLKLQTQKIVNASHN